MLMPSLRSLQLQTLTPLWKPTQPPRQSRMCKRANLRRPPPSRQLLQPRRMSLSSTTGRTLSRMWPSHWRRKPRARTSPLQWVKMNSSPPTRRRTRRVRKKRSKPLQRKLAKRRRVPIKMKLPGRRAQLSIKKATTIEEPASLLFWLQEKPSSKLREPRNCAAPSSVSWVTSTRERLSSSTS